MRLEKVKCANGDIFSPEEGALRVRYSKTDGHNKNTLLTFKDVDETLLFGIARCNLKAGDRFSRKIGREVAASRMLMTRKAIKDSSIFRMSSAVGVATGNNGLWGICEVKNVKHLLRYFREIDEIIDSERQHRYSIRRKAA